MRVYGHAEQLRRLTKDPPQVALLLGPKSVGKTAIAKEMLKAAGCDSAQTMEPKKLTAEAARDIKRFASVRPHGKRKGVLACLDGTSPAALNALLKVLEEPPHYLSVAMTASTTPPLTILSRAHVERIGYLTEAETKDILISKFGVSPEAAATAARAGRGQVRAAHAMTDLDAVKNPVISAAKAAADGDLELLHKATARWDNQAHQLLQTWLEELVSGNRRVFTPPEFFGLKPTSPGVAQAVAAMRSGARARIAARTAMSHILYHNA